MPTIRFIAIACLCLLALPLPAQAAPSRDQVFAMILAGDDAALRAALSAEDPAAQRAAFSAFVTPHPAVADASAALLRDHPGDAGAMVARAWHLYALGWTIRGSGMNETVNPDALVRMDALHAEAMALADAAVAARPEMVAASDLILALAPTLGADGRIPRELDRIMALTPTRQSLQLAANGMAPRWGGPRGWADDACDRWAAVVADVPDYTPEVCALDMLFSAWGDRDDKALAWERLAGLDHAILDPARIDQAMSGLMPTAEAVAVLERALDEGKLMMWQANRLDGLKGEVVDPGRLGPAERAVLPKELAHWRAEADFNPASSYALEIYVRALGADGRENGADWPADEIDRRYAMVFELAPYDFETWLSYGELRRSYLDLDEAKLEAIEAARLYYINGVVAANHSAYALWALEGFNRDVWARLDKRNLDAMDATGAPAFAKDEFDRAVVCPAVRSIRLMQAVCEARGGRSCPKPGDPTSPWPEMLERAAKRKACEVELTAEPGALVYDMQDIALPDG